MKKIFRNKRGASLAASATILSSTAAGTASVVTAAAGENVMAWVMLFINAAILISNAALEIYRNWRDKDKPTPTPTINPAPTSDVEPAPAPALEPEPEPEPELEPEKEKESEEDASALH